MDALERHIGAHWDEIMAAVEAAEAEMAASLDGTGSCLFHPAAPPI